MSISLNTNGPAQTGLENLNSRSRQLGLTEKQVATGKVVADAFDNGAIFAIAQNLTSDVSATGAVNGQLGAALGSVNVANAAATNISNTLIEVQSTLVQLADSSVTGNARAQLQAQYQSQVQQISQQVQGANYNGTNLIGAGGSNLQVIQNPAGGQLTVAAQDLNAGVAAQLTPVTTAASAQNLLANGFQTAQANVGTALNSFAASAAAINNQIAGNQASQDATTQGLGALTDANLAKTAAALQSQQIGQQLATQSLAIANAAPNILGAFFR